MSDDTFDQSELDSFVINDTSEKDTLEDTGKEDSFDSAELDSFVSKQNPVVDTIDQEVVAAPETDYVQSASIGVKRAIDKVDTYFNTTDPSKAVKSKAYTLKEKASMLGMANSSDLEGVPDKDIDQMLIKRKANAAALMFPDFVNKADAKSLEYMFSNPEVVNKLNNSAKARAMKSTTVEKFLATNKASILAMGNNLSFITGKTDFDEWAYTYQILASERMANNVETKGTPVLNNMYAKWHPFSDKSEFSFVDIAKYILTDPDGAKAAYAEASNSAFSVGASIAGRVAGGAVGVAVGAVGSPIGMVGGAVAGSFLAGGVAAMDEFIQNEIAEKYTTVNGVINWEALRTDIDSIKARWQIEAVEHSLIGAVAETLIAPKLLGLAGKVIPDAVKEKVATKVFKSSVVNALAKAGKFTGKVGKEGVKEFVGEGLGGTAPKNIIDFQNGRLTTNKVLSSVKDFAREGTAGAITAGTVGSFTVSLEAGLNKAQGKIDAYKADNTPPPIPPSAKPFNERTAEESATADYKTRQAETTVDHIEGMDQDADTLDSVTDRTDREKVNLVDAANAESFTTDDTTDADGVVTRGVFVEGTPTEENVNGADLNTLIGEDVAVFKEILSEDRYVALDAAIKTGENFTFTYGEWIVGTNKLKTKHPTITHLVINKETEMSGYEAVSHLSEVLDLLQSQYDSLVAPAVESTPPAIPGISADMIADSNTAAIGQRKQTGVVKSVTPTGNINQVKLTLIDGSEHTIELYDKESAQDIQGIADNLSKQFSNALKASGNTPEITQQASLQGIPVIMRVLIKRAKALGKPLSEMAKSITFKSDASSGSAYIGMQGLDSKSVVYGVGRTAQRVSTVAHEFAHAILHFMTVDSNELEAQSQAGTLNAEGIEYLDVIRSTAKLLGLNNISEVNNITATTLTDPKTGKIITKNQSRQPLTMRTVVHEKMATTMEVFLKAGKLETETMEVEMAQILLYWRGLIPSEVLSRQASVAAVEGWTYSGEYHQALDPTDEVGHVFHGMYSVNQEIDKTIVPMFNFNYFPVEILGKGGQLIINKLIEAKHTAIAKVFAKMYADSINARHLINTPEAIAKMNKRLSAVYASTYAGGIVMQLNALGLKVTEAMSKDLSAIQELLNRNAIDKAEYTGEATTDDIITLTEAESDPSDSAEAIISRMVETFTGTKVEVYTEALESLGYVTDDKVKQASEDMLAKSLPAILNDQFTQIVAAFPVEAKQLFAAYIKSGKVSSRVVNKQVAVAAGVAINKMPANKLSLKGAIAEVRTSNTAVVNLFNQGKYLEALATKFDGLVKSGIMDRISDIMVKVAAAKKAIETFSSVKYMSSKENAGKVHPETMAFLRDVLFKIDNKIPVIFTNIDSLDPDLNMFTEMLTEDMLANIAGKELGSVEVTLELGDYARVMAKVAAHGIKLEKEAQAFLATTQVQKMKGEVLKSTKVWDVRSWLPQVNSVHGIFSAFYTSQEAYHRSFVFKKIYAIEQGEAKATNGANEIGIRIKKMAAKSLSRKFEPTTLTRTGIIVNTRDQLISVLMHLGSTSGRDTLLRTHGAVTVDPNTGTDILMESELMEDLNDMFSQGVINADDIKLANDLWKEFPLLLGMLKEVYRRDKGVAVGEIVAVPYDIGGLTLDGGYWPLSTDEVIPVGANSVKFLQKVFGGSLNFGRTKERGSGKKEPLKLGLGPMSSYVNYVMRDYHIKPPMALFNAFINDTEVREHLVNTRPGALENPSRIGNNSYETGIIGDWIKDVDGQIRSDVDPNTDKLLNWLVTNTAVVFYSMDALAAVTNLVSGLPAALPYTASKSRLTMNAALWFFKKGTFNERMQLSEQMKANEKSFVQYFANTNTEDLYSQKTKTKEFVDKVSMTAMRMSQHILESIVWNTEFESQSAKGVPQEAAVIKADAVTRDTIGSYSISNRAIGQKGGTLGRLRNMATMHLFKFKASLNLEMNRDGATSRKAYMSTMLIGSALLSTKIAMELYDMETPDKAGEDEEEKKFKMQLQMYTEMLPYFFGSYGRMLSATINFGIGADLSITPMEQAIKKSFRAPKRLAVIAKTNSTLTTRDFADVMAMATMLSGVPFSGLANLSDIGTTFSDHDKLSKERRKEDALRIRYTQEFDRKYNPLID